MSTPTSVGTMIGGLVAEARANREELLRHLGILRLDEYADEEHSAPEPWVLPDFIRRQELVLLTGIAKSGKSMMATNMAIAVATGTGFLGSEGAPPGRVLVCQTEIARGAYGSRLVDMLAKVEIPETPEMYFTTGRFFLDSDKKGEGIDVLEEALDLLSPSLLILDPFYTLHRGEENDAPHISRTLTRLKTLVMKYETSCLLVHHQGKPTEGTNSRSAGHKARGSSAFADVPDAAIALQQRDGATELRFDLRNGPPRDPLMVRFDSDSLWWTCDGGGSSKPMLSPESVQQEVRSNPGMNRTSLESHLRKTFAVGQNAVSAAIVEASRLLLIEARQDGKSRSYFAKSHDSEQHLLEPPL